MEEPPIATDHQITTTDDQTTTTDDQSRQSADRRREFLASLHTRGGFILACKTVVTLHQVATSESGASKWEIIDYGILALLSKQDELSLMIGDVESGDLRHEFAVTLSSRYTVSKSHFHMFLTSDGKLCGMSFVDVSVAEKVTKVIRRLIPVPEGVSKEDDVIPSVKRVKVGDNYSSINSGDAPVVGEDNEGSGNTEDSNKEGTDETDFHLFSKKKKDAFTIDDISGPSYFRHLTGEAAPGGSLKGAGPGGQGSGIEGTFERGTKRSDSFMEVTSSDQQPLPEKPENVQVASSTSDISSSTSFASSFSGSSTELPEPPELVSSHDTLLSQINTFDRRTLHHVNPEEIANSKNKTDSRKRSLTSIFKNGFDQLLPKLQALRQVSTVATISSSGEEGGFDDFDGLLFE